jgi:hydrogenase/urease accessory protein HupE
MNMARNKSLAFLRRLLVIGVLAALTTAQAHLPFESSTRVIAHDTTVEIALTVGMDGGKALLAGAPPDAFRIREVGPSFELPKEFATRFYETSSGGVALVPDKIEVRTDGLEFDVVLEYPRPAGNALAVRAVFLEQMPSMYNSSFILTDENGNIFASKLLSRRDESAGMTLPAAATATEPATVGTTLPATATNSIAPVKNPAVTAQSVSQTNLTTAIAAADNSTPPNTTLGFWDFLQLGIRHILTGYDHLLFLCGLLVACRKVAPMLAIITCFTIAHSLTLALSALNLVQISPRITEPLIAVTIVFVGIENFRGRVDMKTRCGLALGFGLIHGFGFATALRETGLGGTGLALAKPLFAFNLGVECGQLAVAAVFLPLLFALRKNVWFERHGTQIISAVVVVLGGFWLVQRVLF